MSFPTICSDLPNRVDISLFSHLEGLELVDEFVVNGLDRPIDVLVGSDFYYRIITGDIVKGDSGPVAISSIFGYFLSGPSNHLNSNLILQGNHDTLINDEPDELISTLKRSWETENMGVKEAKVNICEPPEAEERPFLVDIRFVDKRYQVKLPWVENDSVPTLNKDF